MTAWEGLNRRKFPRMQYPCLVTVSIEGEDKSSTESNFLTHTENIGIGGVSLFCPCPVKRYDKVSMEIDLLNFEEHLKCKGKVVWCVERKDAQRDNPSTYDIGIEFEEVPEETAARLAKHVKRLEERNKFK